MPGSVLDGNFGPFKSLLDAAGIILGAGAALLSLIWGSVLPEQGVPKAARNIFRVIVGLCTAVALVVVQAGVEYMTQATITYFTLIGLTLTIAAAFGMVYLMAAPQGTPTHALRGFAVNAAMVFASSLTIVFASHLLARIPPPLGPSAEIEATGTAISSPPTGPLGRATARLAGVPSANATLRLDGQVTTTATNAGPSRHAILEWGWSFPGAKLNRITLDPTAGAKSSLPAAGSMDITLPPELQVPGSPIVVEVRIVDCLQNRPNPLRPEQGQSATCAFKGTISIQPR